MSPDEEMVVIFGALHLVALAMGIVLFVMFLRSESGHGYNPPADDDDSGGGGGNDRVSGRPKSSPPGGIPLPDAEPSSVRLRSHETLRDAHRRGHRRAAPEPHRPARRRRVGA